MKAWRQGDVIVTQVKELPEGSVEVQSDGILAYGEATGHSHRIAEGRVRFFRNEHEDFFEVMSGVALLTHEGHFEHRFPKGLYRWHRQREADWLNEVARNVQD